MALRGVEPADIEKRLKLFMYGAPGVGKTMAAIQFPKPYVIDTERGCENKQYRDAIKAVGGNIFQSNSFNDALMEVSSLLTEKHDYKTLVIDTVTVIHTELILRLTEVAEKKAAEGKKDIDMRRVYFHRDQKMQVFLSVLMKLDMNIILTSHTKPRYEKMSGENIKAGDTFDCYDKLDRVFDLILELKERGDKRLAIIKKSRIENFIKDQSFDFSYAEISDRYGRELIEKGPENFMLATEDQVEELSYLCDLNNVSRETISKWLNKAGVSSLSEMNADIIQKCINSLINK